MMRKPVVALAVLGILASASGCSSRVEETALAGEPQKPNVLLIVADDLGFSDLGAFGGEISTPNLDRLANAGVRLTDFHVAPTCSPTRAMLLTGVDNHVVGLGTMGEMLPAGAPVRPGYEGYLNDRALTVADIFHGVGYRTMMAGKWHLGKAPGQTPDARGFDRSFVLLEGGGSHFGDTEGGTWGSDMLGANYREDGKKASYPHGTYTGDFYTDRLLGYVDEAQAASQPFFAYLAFTEPHWPLQAPPELIAKYRGRYDSGPVALREERLARLGEMGLIAPSHRPHEMVKTPEWSTLSAAERKQSARAMEIYAAMVERLDFNVGRVVAHLEKSGQLKNTIIVFMSDNGPDGTSSQAMLQSLAAARTHDAAPIDNSLDNMGAANSFVVYGQDWAQAGSAPFNRVKAYTTEGGIRVPAFVSGPGVKGGRIAHTFLHVTDVLPTLAGLAGVAIPAQFDKMAPSGQSFAAVLAGEDHPIHQDTAIGWELFFGRAIRLNNWKAVRLAPASPVIPLGGGDGAWSLYDLSNDSGETTDLSATHPEKLRELTAAWDAYAQQNGVVSAP